MDKYSFNGNTFIVRDYQNAKRFSSFLPAIAGVNGKPMWAFYANVGQCMGGFGTDNKETPIAPFDSAVLAYQNIPLRGFRTFIKFDGKLSSPFFKASKNQTLKINKSNFEIIEENKDFEIRIIYSTISNRSYPGLIRKVCIKNKLDKNVDLEVIDGLLTFLPYGLSNYSYGCLSTLMSAYCEVKIKNNVALAYNKSPSSDSSDASLSSDSNIYLSLDKNNNRLPLIVDKTKIFKNDATLINPLGLNNVSFPSLVDNQLLENQIPSAFTVNKKSLNKDETLEFISVFSISKDEEETFKNIDELSFNLLDKMIDETEELVDSLAPRKCITNNELFDLYVTQCFLDNGIRGGFPINIENDVEYLFSRKHGDMERDYNAFEIPATYKSSGPGNFRDVNQNRRNDLYLNKNLYDNNIKLFYSLIQADGYNPLLVTLKGKFALDKEVASFKEGYWVDHWTYNLDLIENFKSIYPDKMSDLLNDKSYPYFSSYVLVEPRKNKYFVNSNGDVRQYNAVDEKKTKETLEKLNTKLNATRWLKNNNDEIVLVSLMSKIINLIVVKFSTLDAMQHGIEMEAEKPGWNDALNGLPGLIGSSMSETIELLRMVKFAKSHLDKVDNVEVLSELKILFNEVNKNVSLLLNDKLSKLEYWDLVNNAREEYREAVQIKVNNELAILSNRDIKQLLNKIEKVLNKGINEVKQENNGVLACYFINEVSKYHLLDELNYHNNKIVVVDEFKQIALPLFLESNARLAKLGKKYFNKNDYQKVLKSGLKDHKTKFYQTSISLDECDPLIGRITRFSKGWLERESNFLHMTYKYLLGLLRAGLHKEFFKEMKDNFVCFMDPNKYGRSPIENCSFLVTSNNPNKARHKEGEYARLTGANAEVIDMFYRLIIGEHLFMYDNDGLHLTINPSLTKEFFDNNKEVKAYISGINFTLYNPNMIDTYLSNKISYVIDNKEYDVVPNDISIAIREGNIKDIKVIIE